MAHIDDLPAELIAAVLLALADQGTIYYPYRPFRSLAAASRIAPRWQAPAPALMWREIEAKGSGSGSVQAILDSPALGRYRTVRIELDAEDSRPPPAPRVLAFTGDPPLLLQATLQAYGRPWVRVSEEEWEAYASASRASVDAARSPAYQVLRRVVGVRELVLVGDSDFGSEWMELPSLADITTLNVQAPFTDDADELSPSFRLRHLLVCGNPTDDPSSSFGPLIETSAATLETLHLGAHTSNCLFSLLHEATPLSSIPSPSPSGTARFDVLRCLKTFTYAFANPPHVNELGILADVLGHAGRVEFVGVRLGEVWLGDGDERDVNFILLACESVGKGAWEAVSEVRVVAADCGPLRESEMGATLLQVCAKAGVKVVEEWDLDDEWVEDWS